MRCNKFHYFDFLSLLNCNHSRNIHCMDKQSLSAMALHELKYTYNFGIPLNGIFDWDVLRPAMVDWKS